jgi:anti-sigma regulatory factor (Ser/Thr protein kinase)
MAVQCSVGGDGEDLLVALTGELGLPDVAPVRLRLLKCLAEQPGALLLDLAGLTVAEPLALSVFTAVTSQAARWPGTRVLLCAPPPATRNLLAGAAYHRLPLFDSTDEARAHAGQERQTMPSLTDELLPISGAARHARNVATDACLRWDLPHLIAPASLIVSELVSNVVEHAHTMMTLRLSLRRRFLNIAVRDGSPDEPVQTADVPAEADGGRGLFLVKATSHSWGWLPTDDGKVVWAALQR